MTFDGIVIVFARAASIARFPFGSIERNEMFESGSYSRMRYGK
jgi:hypothetical protein